jgi:hypothetical protein
VVKGLAKLANRLRHDQMVKCVDVSLFTVKSGYSPMTRKILTVLRERLALPVQALIVGQRQLSLAAVLPQQAPHSGIGHRSSYFLIVSS